MKLVCNIEQGHKWESMIIFNYS